ncbi:MAG: 3-hydroxyacyl-CoA dehydrogenase NAD-binding domain-containing protein [Verrucomicrobiales bacterium]
MKNISTQRTYNDYLLVSFDREGSSANIFDEATLVELGQVVDQCREEEGLRGVIFLSAKKSIYLAGADLNTLSSVKGELPRFIKLGQSVFQSVADLPIPTVAAVHGACAGGGFEFVLACDYRVADPEAKVGLPEVNLGILPAWGGCTRLPRLLGLAPALGIILQGSLKPAGSKRMRAVFDGFAARERLVDLARSVIERRRPRKSKRSLWARLTAPVVCSIARKQTLAKTRGHYPAPLAALNVCGQAFQAKTLTVGFEAEAREVQKLAGGSESRALIQLYLNGEKAKKVAQPSREIRRVTVVGAGVMGAGIAHWLSARGFQVALADMNPVAVGHGMARIVKLYKDAVRRGLLTSHRAQQAFDRVTPLEKGLGHPDLVIEAIVEKMNVKKELFACLGRELDPEVVLASNTSALSIEDMAQAAGNPQRVCGLHFFNPVHRMNLVEVVASKSTSSETVELACWLVSRIGKTPVVVKDHPGFLVNRALLPSLTHAVSLVQQGVGVEDVDAAMLDFGMPMGSCRLLDEVGLDVALHVAETLREAPGQHLELPDLLRRMVEEGLLGRKSGAGFYLYPSEKLNRLPGLPPRHRTDKLEIAKELAGLMADEVQRCVDQGVVGSAWQADLAMVLGTGFAPFRGGPLAWRNQGVTPSAPVGVELPQKVHT